MQILNAQRPCAVSGSFYSSDKKKLSLQVKKLLSQAKKSSYVETNALIVPHAGYVFSASTAAIGYKTLKKKYKTIFLIGSSHYIALNGASIYTKGEYQTPLGNIKMNQEIISSLMKNPLFEYKKNAHTKEHTLEVQLPFLQTIYKNDLNIVPIIIGTTQIQNIKKLAKILKPYFEDKENLFIISTDLSHFPNYKDANKVDKKTLNAIVKNSPTEFLTILKKNSSTKNVMTLACGWSSVLTLLYMTQESNYKYELLEYINSGDTTYGDKKRVVGYGVLRVYKNDNEFYLNTKEKNQLLEIAKLAIYEAVINNKRISINKSNLSSKLKLPLGAFVTLYKHKKLRGCIGHFEPKQPLYSVIIDMEIAAAFNDTRFQKVTKEELINIEIEISILTPRKKISSFDEIIIGQHGIYIQKGGKTGTFLPHVATDMNWGVEKFVEECAVNKAGISKEEIKNAKLFTYKAIVFH
jgi:AmmeMemoRadiSam system protein B/AmmeMemoRadiSam system protein A